MRRPLQYGISAVMKMRVDKLMAAMGCQSRHQLAQELGVTHQAVYKWGKHLPPLRVYRLLDERPELRRIIEDRAA